MLQRQQASAVIAARQKIVEGAVGMVEMALDMLSAKKIIDLDPERRAAMVSNLLVVLCSDRDAQRSAGWGRSTSDGAAESGDPRSGASGGGMKWGEAKWLNANRSCSGSIPACWKKCSAGQMMTCAA
jgi:hypothetical protein